MDIQSHAVHKVARGSLYIVGETCLWRGVHLSDQNVELPVFKSRKILIVWLDDKNTSRLWAMINLSQSTTSWDRVSQHSPGPKISCSAFEMSSNASVRQTLYNMR